MNAPQSAAIVGAGVAGLCTAYHLAEAGIERVLLIDKNRVGSGSSSKSGAVNTMLMPTETGTRARAITMDIFERFSEVLEGYTFHQCGCMFIFGQDQFHEHEKNHHMYREASARFEVLDKKAVEERFPDLKLDENECTVLDLRGGWNEPDTYIRALLDKVRQMGVEIRENEPVEDIVMEGDRVCGVRTAHSGAIRVDVVINTLNAWTNSLLSQTGTTVPARNFVHQRFVTAPFDKAPRVPATNDDANDVYFRPTEDNRLLIGSSGPSEPLEIVMPGTCFNYNALEVPPDVAPYILEKTADRLPMLEGVELQEHRVGLISMTADMLPNIGPVSSLPGLFLASNFNSGGFGYHAVAGQLLKEFIVDGKPSMDVDAFSPNRWNDFDTEGFLQGNNSYGKIRRH